VSGTYTATVTREGRWWLVAVPEIDGVTQARRLADAETAARELIAVTLGVDVADVTVDVHVQSVDGVDVARQLATIRTEREAASQLERHASAKAQELARDLAAKDVPLRDIGAILGVSHQRAHQLVAG
jgi:ribosomal protein L12E/L44/L45/RPP1/RPP2